MLAGCSSSALLSPRHRLRSEAPSAAAQFQPCNYPMNAQRFDLACGSTRNEASRPIRAVGGISVEKKKKKHNNSNSSQIERPSIRLPPLSAGAPVVPSGGEGLNRLKRLAERGGEGDVSRAKRKRAGGGSDDVSECDEGFWFSQGFETPVVVPFSLTCAPSQEEDRVCFVPSEVITNPNPNPNPNWFQSITNVGEPSDLRRPEKERSGSSSSGSDDRESDFGQTEYAPPGRVEGNGSRPVINISIGNAQGRNKEAVGFEEDRTLEQRNLDLELINLLSACVEAVGSKSIAETNHYIARLGELASPRGSPMARLVAYYTEALALRVSRIWPQVFQVTPPRECDRIDDDSGAALRFLNQSTPIPKFIHFTSNEILLRAFEGKDRVHIIDFDIRQGLQWPGLLQSLASRVEPPSHVRITGVGDSKGELNETGDRLSGFAEALGIPFEFHPVVDRLEDVRLWMLHVTANETVAVNCLLQLHKTLHDGAAPAAFGGALGDFLGLLRSTNPSVVLLAEQETDGNGESLESRVAGSLRHYSALFDSLDQGLPRDSAARIKIEEMFAREIKNVVACEGSDRVERHEEYSRWRVRMERGGFRNIGITDREAMQSKMLLRMYNAGDDGDDRFGVERIGGSEALTLSFGDQPLYTVSAWSPVEGGGGAQGS